MTSTGALCLWCGVAKPHIEADQIETAYTYECIDDSGEPGHAAEDDSDKIKVEEADQSPVSPPPTLGLPYVTEIIQGLWSFICHFLSIQDVEKRVFKNNS